MNKVDFRSLANENIRSLTPYQPGKPIEELERELGITSSIKLASNENPLGPSPNAIHAAQNTLFNAHIYPDGDNYLLKKAIAEQFSVHPAQITVGNGSENILELIVKSYIHKNDSAVISQYAFLTIPILLKAYGANFHVTPAQNFGHDIDAMIKASDERTRILFLVNPNNPTGTFTNKNDFVKLMNKIPPSILVVVDEAYSEYISHPDYPDTLSYIKEFPNLLVCRTFSKVYGLAALRLGYSISSPEIADMLNRARLPFNVNTIAAKAACAALLDKSHIKQSIELNEEGKQQLEKHLNEIGIKYIPSVANFIAINVGNAALVYQELLKTGVIVRPLTAYDMPEYIRVTIGTYDQNERFINALKNILRK